MEIDAAKLQVKVLKKIRDMNLRMRAVREYRNAHTISGRRLFRDTEVMIFELIEDCELFCEKDIVKIFGMAVSSANVLVKRLIKDGYISKDEKNIQKAKPLRLTKQGEKVLAEIRQSDVGRYIYLFKEFHIEDWAKFLPLLEKIDKSVKDSMDELIFDRNNEVEELFRLSESGSDEKANTLVTANH